MAEVNKTRGIGSIGNYYGGLDVKAEEGKFYWSIQDWDGHGWVEIPHSLYLTLMEYEDARIMNEEKK